MSKVNHYKWLEKHLPDIFRALGLRWDFYYGIVGAHGDKFYQYRKAFDDAGIPFPHGCAIGLLSYVHPYGDEVRETKNGWVSVDEWIVKNYERFKPVLPPVDPNDPDTKDIWQ